MLDREDRKGFLVMCGMKLNCRAGEVYLYKIAQWIAKSDSIWEVL